MLTEYINLQSNIARLYKIYALFLDRRRVLGIKLPLKTRNDSKIMLVNLICVKAYKII